MLVLSQIGHCLYLPGIAAAVEKYALHTFGQKVEQNLDQFTRMNGPSEGGKAYLKAGGDAVLVTLAGSAGKDFRSRTAGGDEAAFSGALCFKIKPGDFAGKLADQVIFKSGPLPGRIKKRGRITGLLMGNGDADLGRGGEGVSLNVVNGQYISPEGIGTLSRFISRIAFVVNGFQ